MDAFFEPLPGNRFLATAHTRGPWSPQFMHAGPPVALLAHVCAELAGDGMLLGRISVEILDPVPVGPVEVTAQQERPGGRVCLVGGELTAGGRTVMLARCWFIRQSVDEPLPATPALPPPDRSGTPMERSDEWGAGYLDAVEWRWVEGGFEAPGPGCVWARPRMDLVAGEPLTPVERLLVIADSASGISAVDSPSRLLFVNTDLTVHLRRAPVGEWLWMSAVTRIDQAGVGVCTGTIGDAAGDAAATGQLLFVQRRG